MKKLLAGLFLLSSIVTFSDELIIKGGLDVFNDYNGMSGYIEGGVGDNSLGYELSVEYLKSINTNFSLGVGIGYQGHASAEGKNEYLYSYYNAYGNYVERTRGYDDQVYYNSIPIYLTAKYQFETKNRNIKPYIKANIGYSFNLNDDDLTYSDRDTEYVYDWYDDDYDEYVYNRYSVSYDTDVKDGLYFGIGGGVEISNFVIDLMYQGNLADAEITDLNGDVHKESLDLYRLTLNFGYAFQF